MPSVSERIEVREKPGLRRICRNANRRSWSSTCIGRLLCDGEDRGRLVFRSQCSNFTARFGVRFLRGLCVESRFSSAGYLFDPAQTVRIRTLQLVRRAVAQQAPLERRHPSGAKFLRLEVPLRFHSSPAREYKFIAVGVFEFRHGSPNLFLRFFGKLHALGFEQLRGCKNIVAPKRHRLESADTAFMSGRREERKIHVGARDQQFNPSLPRTEGLIGRDLESHFLRVELQSPILIADGNADNFDAAYHRFSPDRNFSLVEILGIYLQEIDDAIWYRLL